LLVERHDFQGSRLFSPRAFAIGVAAWRVLSGGKNQPFTMPVSITNFGRFGNRRIFFKKPLASGRIFDILCAQFRLKAGPRSRWRAAWSNQAEGQQLQTDN